MRTRNKILLSLLILAIGYLCYTYVNYRADLLHVFDVPDKYTIAQAGADLTIIDFNSPECKKCLELHPILKEAIESDGRIRYIPRILSSGNAWYDEIYSAVYAAAEQDKFSEMFEIVYKNWPIKNKSALFNYASDIGLDTVQLARDMERPEIKAYLDNNMDYFKAWHFDMAPTLVIGRKKLFQPRSKIPTVEFLRYEFTDAR